MSWKTEDEEQLLRGGWGELDSSPHGKRTGVGVGRVHSPDGGWSHTAAEERTEQGQSTALRLHRAMPLITSPESQVLVVGWKPGHRNTKHVVHA